MKSEFKTVSVIGLGYIGLPTAAMLASRKVNVIGVDVNENAVQAVNRGEILITEPDLDMVVSAAVNQGYLRATTTPEKADAFIVAVPTPFCDGHKPDLSYVESAARSIAKVLEKGNLIILESTSPVTTTDQMAGWLAEERPDLTFPHQAGEDCDVCLAYCPERVLPGRIMQELIRNDRVVGGMTPHCSRRAIDLYKIFVDGACIETSSRVAEMCKLVENSFRDVNIAFANELSMICDELSIDVWETIALANRHPRVNILQPGPGVGGHCIAVDPWFIVSQSPEQAKLIRTAREVNDSKPEWVLGQVVQAIAKVRQQKDGPVKVACFGLAFKPDIDDLRESPALQIAKTLSMLDGVEMTAVEPFISELPESFSGKCTLGKTSVAQKSADIALLLVDHTEFRSLKRKDFPGIVIDTKGIWD
ncbi:MAG: UDP-N-acetyl-D-mannosamine dehydrogenase [Marinosulfonomonas sp.]|nr:MAG: UDP-N-acetyl-D-mannosamine dehydrogenase [Marinosulfonomonas sp.]